MSQIVRQNLSKISPKSPHNSIMTLSIPPYIHLISSRGGIMAELVSRISPESLQTLSVLNREYRDLTGVSEQTAMRDLEMLVEQGTLKKVGKTRSRQYKLP